MSQIRFHGSAAGPGRPLSSLHELPGVGTEPMVVALSSHGPRATSYELPPDRHTVAGMDQRLDAVLDKTVVLSYTNIGYKIRARDFRPHPRMDGQTVVVTGATSGLGLAAAKQMAGLGADLVIVGRNAEKLERVSSLLGGATTALADLSLIAEVRRLADQLSRLESIDVLVNNAGVLVNERTETSEGLELTFATNLLSHYILTEALIPKLIDSAPSRIINVSSGGMYTQKIRPHDLETERIEYKGPDAYARTKRGQVILTEVWADRLADSGVVVHSMHPGWADTPQVADTLPGFHKIVGRFLRTPEQGADTIVWLASSPEAALETGKFWLDRQARPTHFFERTRESLAKRHEFLEEMAAYAEHGA